MQNRSPDSLEKLKRDLGIFKLKKPFRNSRRNKIDGETLMDLFSLPLSPYKRAPKIDHSKFFLKGKMKNLFKEISIKSSLF